ncbi:MAG: ribonuclease R [Hyphomicrobiaceae bacterium]
MAKRSRSTPSPETSRDPLPSREEILKFMAEADGKVGKREIARAFNVRGADRIGLKKLLAEMSHGGAIVGGRKTMRQQSRLSAVAVMEIVARDADGELLAEPVAWPEGGERPRAVLEFRDSAHALAASDVGIGDRVLARTRTLDNTGGAGPGYAAQPFKKLPREKRRLLGIYRIGRHGGHVLPVDRRELREWKVESADAGEAGDGDLVRFEIQVRGRFAAPHARIIESLGNPQDQRKTSLIAIHAHGLPDEFPDVVMREAESLPVAGMGSRTDLRQLPLLTIDPIDARDHDDAVHASPDADPGNPGGFIVTVAIADVAHYVQPNSRIDREAQLRGNSVYFPDRVVPMLPERLSNDLCSLREGEDRPCLAVRMIFDASGRKRSHRFLRAMMRSAAKLSYQEAQAAIDGEPSDKAAPLMKTAIEPLWQAYAALSNARDRRGPLDLDLPERKILLDAEGRVERVVIPERLTAHRLIEEFMIQANVAAAETLEQRKSPVVYRVHEPPSKEKLVALRDFLDSLGLKLPGAGELKPSHFNRVLEAARDMPVADLVSEVVVRSQSQADYRVENAGHFGLHLTRYAHFTSPIRRYADLLVHRSLVRALDLGDGGLDKVEDGRLKDIAKQISDAERRAMAAERETVDRLIAAHLADRVGAEFQARISGVTRSGLFVRLADTGADGFVPISSLGGEYYIHVETHHALVGSQSGLAYRLGDSVSVRLLEVIPSAGALRFEMLSAGRKGFQALAKGRHAQRGRSRRPPRNKRRR